MSPGLLARLLQKSEQSISAVIFEGEAGIDFRSQGGTLDLLAIIAPPLRI
jgi:hypothetical protein